MQATSTLADADFRAICDMMQRASGIRLGQQKKPLVASRLMRRLRALGIDGYADYVKFLAQTGAEEERRTVVDLLTTNETFFFREPVHFELLASQLSTLRRAPRLWSAASSSGEEVYTLAITCAETLGMDCGWEILGSDLCRNALESAGRAVYPQERIRNVPAPILRRYFLKGVGEQEGKVQVASALRERCRFACLNLIAPLPPKLGHFDAIFLRNVLIYFDQDGKRDIVGRLLPALEPGGRLYVGHSESLHGLGLPLRAVQPAVYERT